MLRTTNVDDLVLRDRFSTLMSDTFDTNFLTPVDNSMASINDQCSSLRGVETCDISTVVENHRKKENFRQRIRSLRQDCEDGPLLASTEDVTEADDDSGFVVASRSKRGRRTREFVRDCNLTEDTSSPNQSFTEIDSSVPESLISGQICSENVIEFMKARYPQMHFSELEILLQMANRKWSNFKDLSSVEMYEKLEELKRRRDACKDKNDNLEKLPSKPAWTEMKPTSESRVIDFNECTICLGAWDSDRKIKLEECGHCFHSECLQNWMKMKNTCPFCCTYSLSPSDFPKLS